MMYTGNHMGTGGWIFSIFATLIIIGLIVALILWAVSQRSDPSGSAPAADGSSHEILERRLASGERTLLVERSVAFGQIKSTKTASIRSVKLLRHLRRICSTGAPSPSTPRTST